MLIETIDRNAEQTLLVAIEQSVQRNVLRGALHFRSSGLDSHPRHDAILLALKPTLLDRSGAIYYFTDGDLVVTWSSAQKAVLEEIRERLYSVFSLTGTEALDSYYDFAAEGEELRQLCKRKIEALPSPVAETPSPVAVDGLSATVTESLLEFTPKPIALPELTPQQIESFHEVAKQREFRSRPKILVVEDQPFSSKLLVGLLGRITNTTSAPNAEAALEIYLAEAPDILFLDVEMPGVDGHQLAEVIHKLDTDAYIVIVTANNNIEDVVRAKQNGAKGFVAKPYSKQKILENVEHFIRERTTKT